jgi:2-polyprenyl-6-methoxyphenol hydroxylase-like FAD-dependent oxidoreductase
MRGEVLIVGAGIGGLSASIALHGQGFGVTILEIQPDLHSSVYGGATIPGFPCMNGITRPKLHKILTDRAIDSGVTIEYGSTISDLRDEGHHVEVTRGDGSRRRADLVVGADGVRSVVRRFVLDAGLEPQYNGQSAFRVNIPASRKSTRSSCRRARPVWPGSSRSARTWRTCSSTCPGIARGAPALRSCWRSCGRSWRRSAA